MKFNVGDQIKLKTGHDTITHVDMGKDGQLWYQISSGRYTAPCLELVKAAPGEAVCPVCGKPLLTPEPPKEDKPKFKAGDKAKVIGNTCGHIAKSGDVITLSKPTGVPSPKFQPAWRYNEHGGFISKRDIEPYTEPFSWDDFKAGKIAVHCDTEDKAKAFLKECETQGCTWFSNIKATDDRTVGRSKRSCYACHRTDHHLQHADDDYWTAHDYTIIDYPFAEAEPEPKKEPVKLYCVKSYEPGEWVTKGEIYELDPGNTVKMDDGWVETYSNNTLGGMPFKRYFAPLVSRPAKVGEYVYIREFRDGGRKYQEGNIYKATDELWDGRVSIVDDNGLPDTLVWQEEYLVIDGYDGRYEEPEKPTKEMTVAEIEKELGYPVKVIKGEK